MLLLGRRTAEEKVAAFLIGWRDRVICAGGTVSRTLTRFDREKMLVIVSGAVRLLDASRAGALAAA